MMIMMRRRRRMTTATITMITLLTMIITLLVTWWCCTATQPNSESLVGRLKFQHSTLSMTICQWRQGPGRIPEESVCLGAGCWSESMREQHGYEWIWSLGSAVSLAVCDLGLFTNPSQGEGGSNCFPSALTSNLWMWLTVSQTRCARCILLSPAFSLSPSIPLSLSLFLFLFLFHLFVGQELVHSRGFSNYQWERDRERGKKIGAVHAVVVWLAVISFLEIIPASLKIETNE